MSVRGLRLMAMSLICMVGFAYTSSAYAADKGDGKKGGGNVVQVALKHADDLKLTDDQKKKLEALADAPKDGEKKSNPMDKVKEILEPAQVTQLQDILKKEKGKKKDGN